MSEELWLNVRSTGGTKNLFFDAQTHGSVFRGVGDMCENKKTLQTRGQHDIVPGMGAYTPELVCTADFTEVNQQKWHTFGLQTSTTLGARTKQPEGDRFRKVH